MPNTDITNAAQLVDAWIAARKARRHIQSAHTEQAYRADMKRWAHHMSPTGTLDGMPLDAFTPGNLDYAVSQLSTDNNYSVRTMQRMFTVMRGLCKWATRNGYWEKDPTDSDDFTISAKAPERLPVYFSDAELARIVTAVSLPPSRSPSRWSIRDRTILALLIGTGIRASELECLTPADILPGNPPVLRIVGKGDKERRIALDKETVRLLDMWLEARTSTTTRTRDNGRLFIDHHGRTFDTNKLHTAIMSWLTQAKVPKPDGAVAHAFRHTFAHRLVVAGVPMPIIQHALGHASLATTSIYTRVSAEDTATITAALDTGSLMRGRVHHDTTEDSRPGR